jgi:hypothetical protein
MDIIRIMYLFVSLCLEGILITLLVLLVKDRLKDHAIKLPTGMVIEKKADKTIYTMKYEE